MSTWSWPVSYRRRCGHERRFTSPATELWLEERAEAAREQHRELRQRRRSYSSPAVTALLAIAVLVFLFICTIMCWIVFQGIFLRSY
jgi:hypothetical protein